MQYASMDERKRHELLWAVSILESPGRFEDAPYKHTIESANRCIRRWGLDTWEQAKAWLFPGWTPPSTREIYL